MPNTFIKDALDAALVRLDNLDFKGSVKAATDAALPANTRTGNVLIADANGAFPTVDTITINTNGTAGSNDGTEAGSDHILVKDEATGANNGTYFLSDPGSAGQKWRLTRLSNANASPEVTSGFYVFIDQGTANPNTSWVISTSDPITLNTTSLTFAKFSGAGQIIAGTGMTKTGDTLNVIGGDGIVANADDIEIDFNTTNLKITASQINTIQDIDTTASPQFASLGIGTTPGALIHILASGVADMRIEATSASTGVATFACYNDTGATDQFVFNNRGTTSTGTEFGISKANLGVLKKAGNGNIAIGTLGTGFLVLGANDTEVVRIDSTPLMTVTGDASITQHMAIGTDAVISTDTILEINELISSGNSVEGINSVINFSSSDNTKKVTGAFIGALMSGSTGGTDIIGVDISIKSFVSAGTATNLIGLTIQVATDASAIDPSTTRALEIKVPVFQGGTPTTLDGINIANQGVSGITTSTAITIQDQSGSDTNNFAIITGTGQIGFGQSTPSTNVHILEDNADTVPAVEIEQLGTGDAALQFSIVGDSYAMGIDNNSADSFKISYAAAAGTAVLGTNDRFVIDSAGLIGIGHSTPDSQLHIKGTGSQTVRVESLSNGSASMFSMSNNLGTSDQLTAINWGDAASGTDFGISQANLGIIQKEGDGDLVLGTVGTGFLVLGTNDTEVMRIDGNQNALLNSARFQQTQGADVASTNNLVLGGDGNDFEITGTTDINLISNLTWQNGSTIRLYFRSTATIKDAQATSTTNITILLDGSADFNPTAGDNIQLTLSNLDGVQAWRETGGRNVL